MGHDEADRQAAAVSFHYRVDRACGGWSWSLRATHIAGTSDVPRSTARDCTAARIRSRPNV